MSHRLVISGSLAVVLIALAYWGVTKLGDHDAGMSHNVNSHASGRVGEGGHATFAALMELVALLEKDAKTDWQAVDIDALHAHLLDMNHLMINTQANGIETEAGSIGFTVSGSKESIPSIHRMVPAHSRTIEQSRGWSISTSLSESGATLIISSDNEDVLEELDALGFYGFMALDSHHQAHHYQMATGGTH